MGERNAVQPTNFYERATEAFPGDYPCGESLEYEAAFIMLQSKLQPKLSAEYGNFVEAAEPINWAEIEKESLSLLEKSKDIRLIIILIRCRLRRIGLPALHEGLTAIQSLLTAFPEDLHPQLIDEGEFEPAMRANALSELEDMNGLLMDIKNHSLSKAAGLQIAIKDVEKAFSSPREEGALPEAALIALMQEWELQGDKNLLCLREASRCLADIKNAQKSALGVDAPEFTQLTHILNLFSAGSCSTTPEPLLYEEPVMEQSLLDETLPVVVAPQKNSETVAESYPVQKEIKNRSDALSKMKEIRVWFTRMEPGSPVIDLLSLAEYATGKSFLELIKILPLEMIEKMNVDRED